MTFTPRQAREIARDLLDDELVADVVAPANAGPQLVLPKQVGRYTIRGLIAVGGMGTVYEAEQTQPHRAVALKVMRHGLSSPNAVARFQLEVELLGSLQHPGIAQIYDADTHQDASGSIPFFVMELIRGRPITEAAACQQLSLRQRLELMSKVCDAVHHGHQKGVIHRDLKPANILVDAGGQPKIIDFGVARAINAEAGAQTFQTQTGEVLGTIQYMSPEQCAGDIRHIDTRSDVYALGAILYELVSTHTPYDLRGLPFLEAARVIRNEAPRSLTQFDRRLRGNIETIILKALAKAPDSRYQSASDFAADLRRHLRGDPIDARQPTILLRLMRWLIRHPAAATFGAAIVVSLLVIGGVMVTANWSVHHRPFDMRLDSQSSRVTIVSFAGDVLHEWVTGTEDGIRFAESLRSPLDDQDSLVTIAFARKAQSPYAGALVTFRLSDPSTPLWIRHVEDDELPSAVTDLGFVGAQFATIWCSPLDIFDTHDGVELVVAWAHEESSWSRIAIHDLITGRVLYQLWHDGSLSSCRWLSEDKLLVFAGMDSSMTWNDVGVDALPYALYPVVCFAVEPVETVIEWPTGHSDTATGWYRYLLPSTHSRHFSGALLYPPGEGWSDARFFRFAARLPDKTEASASWIVGAGGTFIEGTAGSNHQYLLLNEDDLVPDSQLLMLGPGPLLVGD